MNADTPPETDPAGRPKAVLFCPACGHESGVSGDWVVDEHDGRQRYECPDCETTVTTRTTRRDGRRDRCDPVETPADD